MVKLAQDFGCMYPLVDMQGNKGSIDGDSAAAMRYTESKLSLIGEKMLGEIGKKITDFRPNFCESTTEPVVLPSYFPNLLANGSTGIAVGFATSIPPHNAHDLYKALYYILDCISTEQDIDEEKIIDIIKAPDFPLGGVVINPSQVRQAYRTGKGRVLIKSNYIIENDSIVFTTVPYMSNKSSIVSKIEELDMEGVKEIRDESSKEGIRIVIECKKNINKDIIINNIFKKTDLQKSFSMNMLSIVKNKPQVCSLFEMLMAYIEHCIEITIKSIEYDIEKDTNKKHLLDGFIKCLNSIEETIEILRNSEEENVIESLMSSLEISKEQAKNIADTKLRAINNKNLAKVVAESEKLGETIVYNKSIIDNDSKLCEEIKRRFKEIDDLLPTERKTDIQEMSSGIEDRDLIKEENIIISLTNQTVIAASTVEQKESSRISKGQKLLKLKEDDFIKYMISSCTTDDLLLFTDTGKMYKIEAYKIPIVSKTQNGKYLANFIELAEDEKIVQMLSVSPDEGLELFIVTKNGVGKRVAIDKVRGNSIKIITPKENDRIVSVLRIEKENTEVMIFQSSGKALRINIDNEKCPIRVMGRGAFGVKAIKLKQGERVITSNIVDNDKELLLTTENGLAKKVQYEKFSTSNRGSQGSIALILTKDDSLVDAISVDDTDSIIVLTKNGLVKKVGASKIKTSGRAAKGFRIAKLNDGDNIVSITSTKIDEEEIEEGEEDGPTT